MKKLVLLIISITMLASCAQEHPKTYATVSGKLENNKDSLITISSRDGILKTIKLNTDGSFKDTLKVKKATIYTFQTSQTNRAPLFLKNGFDIQLSGDANAFMTSFKYTGIGADNSNYILAQIFMSQSIGNPELILRLDRPSFDKKVASLKQDFDSILSSYKNLDSVLAADAINQSAQMVGYFQKAYAENQINRPGTPSPTFTDYVSYKGGKKSLESFRGKYVYIDVWATWCGPCIQQIPFLQELEETYKNKNIEFVSISTDESRRNGGSWEAAESKWRNFVKDRQMSGVQLWSGKDMSFQKAYQINGIPRFILVDPKGNIIDANAPRPSEPRLKELFNSLEI